MHKLVLEYQLKTNQLKHDSHKKNSSFSINKYMYEKLDTNRNWYYLKSMHTYIKIYEYTKMSILIPIERIQWYQLKQR